MSSAGYIPMELTSAEVKLILRLRQLRKIGETRLFMVTTSPLTIAVMGNIEILEGCYSGSNMYYER
jgi:hypothetical protein